MDHHDWPGWPDEAHAGGPGPHDHDPAFGDGTGYDPLAHDPLGDDPFTAPGVAHDHGAHDPGDGLPGEHELAGDPEAAAGDGGHAGEVYPDDDPFAVGHPDEPAAGDLPDGLAGDAGPVADHPVGADPDLDPGADWADPGFPPPLDLPEPPTPVDGYPWSDPQALGGAPDAGAHPGQQASPPVADLYDYAGDGPAPATGAWQALLDSDDPATSSLARFWGPAAGG
jgi:hypothetical protein